MDNRQDEAWLAFAALVLFVAGIMRIFDAIWAFRYHGALPENLEDMPMLRIALRLLLVGFAGGVALAAGEAQSPSRKAPLRR